MTDRLLAEDAFMLLLGSRGRLRGGFTVDTLGAALLDDLLSHGLVERGEKSRRRRPAQVLVTAVGTADPVLLGALAILGGRSWHPEWTMRLLGRQLRWRVGDRLAEAEELERRRGPAGVRWVPYSNARDRLGQAVRTALDDDDPPSDPRVARLAVLLQAGGRLGRALDPELDRGGRRERADRVRSWRAADDWIADALDHATTW